MYEEEKRYIKETLSDDDKLCAVAEEASELVQAAMKVRRASGFGLNKTPLSIEYSLKNYEEEIIDLLICLMADGLNMKKLLKKARRSPKWARWVSRIKGDTK